MKKMLVIAPYPYLPFFSGGQKFIAKFLEYLAGETELTVISSVANQGSLVKGYHSLPLLKRSFSRYYDTSLVKKITGLVQSGSFDTLVCEHPYMAWLAFRIRKKTGIKVIIHTHNIEYQRFRSLGKWWWPFLRWYEKRSFRKADGLFFITPEDKQFAIDRWKVRPDKCADVPFGIDNTSYPADREECRKVIGAKHHIPPGETILSFNGLLDYQPNIDALKIILDKINPLLLQQPSFRYKIIISGKNLPVELNDLKAFAEKNIIFTGFTDLIAEYLKATDVFLNPVQSGGGVKTKIVEAIGYGATVVSTETGAIGMDRLVCGPKLVTVKDGNWNHFVNSILSKSRDTAATPSVYYTYFNWQQIAARAAKAIDRF